MTDEPVGFFDLAQQDFPFEFGILNKETGEVLFEQKVDGPGAMKVPGRGDDPAPRMVYLKTHTGTVLVGWGNNAYIFEKQDA